MSRACGKTGKSCTDCFDEKMREKKRDMGGKY
jgi:hypothetical protein